MYILSLFLFLIVIQRENKSQFSGAKLPTWLQGDKWLSPSQLVCHFFSIFSNLAKIALFNISFVLKSLLILRSSRVPNQMVEIISRIYIRFGQFLNDQLVIAYNIFAMIYKSFFEIKFLYTKLNLFFGGILFSFTIFLIENKLTLRFILIFFQRKYRALKNFRQLSRTNTFRLCTLYYLERKKIHRKWNMKKKTFPLIFGQEISAIAQS